MPQTGLARTTFETSRAAEYFSVRELQAQTGQPREQFAAVALKELVDNALDACETTGIAPVIDIDVRGQNGLLCLGVEDNGEGIAPETVRRRAVPRGTRSRRCSACPVRWDCGSRS
jgi:DNA topoisomerase VI subunit B